VAKIQERKMAVETLSAKDIQVLDDDVIVLKGRKFYRPYITAAAVNDDTIEDDGQLGSLMLAQESAARGYSGWTGLPNIEQKVFIIEDPAKDAWQQLKEWVKGSSVKIIETRIPNIKFTSLFER
jgi:hypothetical protein